MREDTRNRLMTFANRVRQELSEIPDSDADSYPCYNPAIGPDDGQSLKAELLDELDAVCELLGLYQQETWCGDPIHDARVLASGQADLDLMYLFWIAAAKSERRWLKSASDVQLVSHHVRTLLQAEAQALDYF